MRYITTRSPSLQMRRHAWHFERDVARQPNQELARAAWSYVADYVDDNGGLDHMEEPFEWPWPAGAGGCTWKPTPDDPIRQLVKAAALIAAEIDRLLAVAEAGS